MATFVTVYSSTTKKAVPGLTYDTRGRRLCLTAAGIKLRVRTELFNIAPGEAPMDGYDARYARAPLTDIPGWAISYAISEGGAWVERSENKRTLVYARAFWSGDVSDPRIEVRDIVGREPYQKFFTIKPESLAAYDLYL